MKGISQIVGSGETAERVTCAVYRALRPVTCGACGRLIAEGELFTRWPVAVRQLNLLPRCGECMPFRLDEGEAVRPRSALLDSLLKGAAQAPAASAEEQRGGTAEAVEKRLGPALRRARRFRLDGSGR